MLRCRKRIAIKAVCRRKTGTGEWGEKPRERVTVKLPRGDESECPDGLGRSCPHREPRDTKGSLCPFLRLYGSRRRAGTDVFFMQKEEEKMKKRVISLLLALGAGGQPAADRGMGGGD